MPIDLREFGKAIKDTSSKVSEILLRKYMTEQEAAMQKQLLEDKIAADRQMQAERFMAEAAETDKQIEAQRDIARGNIEAQKQIAMNNNIRDYQNTLRQAGVDPALIKHLTITEFSTNPMEKQMAVGVLAGYNKLLSNALNSGRKPTEQELNKLPPDLRTAFWKDLQKGEDLKAELAYKKAMTAGIYEKAGEAARKENEDITKQDRAYKQNAIKELYKTSEELDKAHTATLNEETQFTDWLNKTTGLSPDEITEETIKDFPSILPHLEVLNNAKQKETALLDKLDKLAKYAETTFDIPGLTTNLPPETPEQPVAISRPTAQSSNTITQDVFEEMVKQKKQKFPTLSEDTIRQETLNWLKGKGITLK